jgi:hypothetical protein
MIPMNKKEKECWNYIKDRSPEVLDSFHGVKLDKCGVPILYPKFKTLWRQFYITEKLLNVKRS